VTPFDHLAKAKTPHLSMSIFPEHSSTKAMPLPDERSLQTLVLQAADGRRGAARRLLPWIGEGNIRVIATIDSLDDGRLVRHMLEWITLGTWASKPFIVPTPLHSPLARIQFYTIFLPREGRDSARVEHLLIAALHEKQPALRQTAAHILGLIGCTNAVPALIEVLHDPVYDVRYQAVKALGRLRKPLALPELLKILPHANDQLSCQIFAALVSLGPVALPALIELSTSKPMWTRWHCMHALGEFNDLRVLPILVQALTDSNESVAWMAAKGLVQFSRLSVGPVLHLLSSADVTPWLVETASYVLKNQSDSKLKPYVDPVLKEMHEVDFRISTMIAAQKALKRLLADGLGEESGALIHHH
jgi:hypothetical protein